MENLVKKCYTEPKKFVEEKSEMDQGIDSEFEYFPKTDITEDTFQPNEKFFVVRETP